MFYVMSSHVLLLMTMQTITTEELRRKIEEEQDFALVNVLSRESFESQHIPGSISIPLDELEDEAPERFGQDDDIVVYCASKACQASPKAAEMLEELGFTNVKDYERGLKGWEESGGSFEGSG